MTDVQLDEIEKLAEAATPGPWTARLTDRGHALWGPLPSGECGSMRIALSSYAAFDRANMLFVEALRDAALPLVKALREARVERDEAHRERADWMHSLERSKADIITLTRERDEALDDARLADCQLDEIVELVGSGGDGSAFGSVESLLCDLKERTEERNEARALLAALKEEHRPADEIRAQLLAEIEAHAETKAEVERLKAALRLLWEEAQDKAAIRDATCDLVEAALAEAAP